MRPLELNTLLQFWRDRPPLPLRRIFLNLSVRSSIIRPCPPRGCREIRQTMNLARAICLTQAENDIAAWKRVAMLEYLYLCTGLTPRRRRIDLYRPII